LSRVIKSKYLVIREPCVLNASQESSTSEPDAVKAAVEQPAEREPDADRLRAEMAEVVKEAEDMVRELLENARVEARHIIASAEEEASRIREQAVIEAEAARKKALEEGYQEGLTKASREMQELKAKTASECENMLKEAERTKEAIILSAEGEIVELALAIARKIIDKEIRENSDIIIKLVRKTLSSVGNAGSVKIRVSPHDFETVLENRELLAGAGQVIDDLEIHLDSRMTPGGFVVESDLGVIDARMETRMNKVEEALREEAGNSAKTEGL